MLAGMGFYDIHSRSESAVMQSMLQELGGRHFRLNDLGNENEISGYWHHAGEKVPIYTGVGDHQCALLGAGNRPNQSISLNLGTGSQVSVVASHVYSSIRTDSRRRHYRTTGFETPSPLTLPGVQGM